MARPVSHLKELMMSARRTGGANGAGDGAEEPMRLVTAWANPLDARIEYGGGL